MFSTVDAVHTLDDLRRFVHALLCQKENLLPDQFRTSEVALIRQNEPCGLQFCLRGPRSVRLAAVWAAEANFVYLYDAKGTRYSKLRLPHRISLPPLPRADAEKVA
jgi:hypothetical protein